METQQKALELTEQEREREEEARERDAQRERDNRQAKIKASAEDKRERKKFELYMSPYCGGARAVLLLLLRIPQLKCNVHLVDMFQCEHVLKRFHVTELPFIDVDIAGMGDDNGKRLVLNQPLSVVCCVCVCMCVCVCVRVCLYVCVVFVWCFVFLRCFGCLYYHIFLT